MPASNQFLIQQLSYVMNQSIFERILSCFLKPTSDQDRLYQSLYHQYNQKNNQQVQALKSKHEISQFHFSMKRKPQQIIYFLEHVFSSKGLFEIFIKNKAESPDLADSISLTIDLFIFKDQSYLLKIYHDELAHLLIPFQNALTNYIHDPATHLSNYIGLAQKPFLYQSCVNNQIQKHLLQKSFSRAYDDSFWIALDQHNTFISFLEILSGGDIFSVGKHNSMLQNLSRFNTQDHTDLSWNDFIYIISTLFINNSQPSISAETLLQNWEQIQDEKIAEQAKREFSNFKSNLSPSETPAKKSNRL